MLPNRTRRSSHVILSYVILMMMPISASTKAASLQDLRWMCGDWSGSLGPQSVAESWSEPHGGTMSTMVRLTNATDTVMIELIAIREEGDSLILHLRQFSPALQLHLAQDMPLKNLTADSVSFAATPNSSIKMLAYRRISDQQMEVDVTVANDTVVTAILHRK